MDFLNNARVALIKDRPTYPTVPPYHPSENLPEWSEFPIATEDNPAYRSIRQLFYQLQLDRENYGTLHWNPLGEIIHPGNIVVLKPNFVSHRNLGEKAYGLTDTDSLVTHGSVIRAVLDYAAKALQGFGKIIIGDCPIQGTDWSQIVRLVALDEIQAYFNKTFPNIDRKSQCVTNDLSPDVGYLAILDGLVAGQKESPLAPTPLPNGLMMAAYNPLAMDAVATSMMGFDIKKLKQINEGFCLKSLPLVNFNLQDIQISSNIDIQSIKDIYQKKAYIPFEPSKGFKGYIEYIE